MGNSKLVGIDSVLLEHLKSFSLEVQWSACVEAPARKSGLSYKSVNFVVHSVLRFGFNFVHCLDLEQTNDESRGGQISRIMTGNRDIRGEDIFLPGT